MIQTEAQSLIAYLNRAGLVGAMEGQSAVWADALPDVDFEDAKEAARTLVRTRTSDQRWVVPGDIRAGVRAIVKVRAEAALDPAAVPDADPDRPLEYVAAIRSGRWLPAPGPADPERVKALIEQAEPKRVPRA